MKKLISLLNARERKTLQTAAVLAGAVAAVLLVFAGRAEVRAGREARRLAAAEERAREADRGLEAAKADDGRWIQARADVRELGSKWLYDPAQGIPGFRYDLRQVFQTAGTAAPEIIYGEAELVRDRLRRVTADFRLTGTYAFFRRLLETVESHPRALHVDKVEFEDIGTQPGLIQVRVTLAGYYYHEK